MVECNVMKFDMSMDVLVIIFVDMNERKILKLVKRIKLIQSINKKVPSLTSACVYRKIS
jgi:hypothetical protein